MAEEQKSYKIVNKTIKDRVEGKPDTRTPAEKKGHMVTWQDAKGNPIGVGPGEMKIIPGPIDPSILRLVARGTVTMEEMGSLTTTLKQFEQEAKQTNAAANDRLKDAEKRTAGEQGATPLMDDKMPPHDANGVPTDNKAEASQMGRTSSREQKERDDLIADHTPDNDSNTVTARSSNGGKSGQAQNGKTTSK